MYSLRDKLPEMLATENKTALAKALGIGRTTLYRWQKDPEQIPVCKLRILAKIKGYTVVLQPDGTTYTL